MSDEIKAVILVGGEGTRLRPLTMRKPKAMAPIVNRPYLEHLVNYLKGHGVREIILALCYLPDQIQSYFADGKAFGVKLVYRVEEHPLGTAGAVKNVEDCLEGTFIVLNGDIFTDLDLTAMLAYHRQKKAAATIALTPVEDPSSYGLVELTPRGRVRRFLEKPSRDEITTNLINAGIYILEPKLLRHIPRQAPFMFENGLFPLLLDRRAPFYGYPHEGYWIDIGTPERYLQLHRDLLRGKMAHAFPGKASGNGVWREEGCHIAASAQIKGPVVIGKGCLLEAKARVLGPAVLGPGCRLGRQAVVEGAILWPGTSVGPQSTLRDCIVGEDSIIEGDALVLENVLLGDKVTIGRGNKLARGLRVWPEKVLAPYTISF